MNNDTRHPLDTALGKITVLCTEAKHAHVEAPSDSPLVIRGVLHRLSAHFHLWPDGTFGIGDAKEPNEWCRERDAFFLRKAGTSDYPTDAASKKAKECIVPVVQKFLAENPRLLVEAQREHLRGKIETQNQTIQELRRKLSDETQTLEYLEADLAAL